MFVLLVVSVHDWKKEEVSKWMRQMSMSLYAHYFPLFSKHDITGVCLCVWVSGFKRSEGG